MPDVALPDSFFFLGKVAKEGTWSSLLFCLSSIHVTNDESSKLIFFGFAGSVNLSINSIHLEGVSFFIVLSE